MACLMQQVIWVLLICTQIFVSFLNLCTQSKCQTLIYRIKMREYTSCHSSMHVEVLNLYLLLIFLVAFHYFVFWIG